MTDYFMVVRQERERTGQAVIRQGERFFGDLEVPPVPVHLVADENTIHIRPAWQDALTDARIETAIPGRPDQITPVLWENQAAFQEVFLNNRNRLVVNGSHTNVVVYVHGQ